MKHFFGKDFGQSLLREFSCLSFGKDYEQLLSNFKVHQTLKRFEFFRETVEVFPDICLFVKIPRFCLVFLVSKDSFGATLDYVTRFF